jgi:hypothetical protein
MRSLTIEYIRLSRYQQEKVLQNEDKLVEEDVITYSALYNLGRQFIKFSSETDHCFTPTRRNYFHPWLNMKHVTDLLSNKYSEISSENVKILTQTIAQEIRCFAFKEFQ